MDVDDEEAGRERTENTLFDSLGIVPLLVLAACALAVWLL